MVPSGNKGTIFRCANRLAITTEKNNRFMV